MSLEPYTAELIAEMAKRENLPLPVEQLETVAGNLTYMRNQIAVLDTVMLQDEYLAWRDEDATV
ncbi:hypothetical protein [Halodesulfovibrio sp. MK-HDV]|jgi:hypothetical protein|uniref:hypothetical protein n=1 Tax=Halodesulfovibrio sp. MK-HDV TaxID=2599925 RepID=UPI00136FF3D5|nr:hypothetical protein [Halodesulfovibrio sp. MK-HDV]KAF1074778.1 hypothetical protein MKHDV_02572 [Halodesulfovibrio sp. MK-HDV]